MHDKLNFKLWLEHDDPEFYLSLIEEGLIPSWLRNVFLAGSLFLGSNLMSGGEIQSAEINATHIVKPKSDKAGKVTIEVKIPLKITRMDLSSEYIKSSIKNELLKFLREQDIERLEKESNLAVNLLPEVFVDIDRSDINPLLTKFDIRELLPNWKFGDQNKLERLLNTFIKATDLEKKQGFHTLKFTIYYNKINPNMPSSQQKNTKQEKNKNFGKNNPTQSNIVK